MIFTIGRDGLIWKPPPSRPKPEPKVGWLCPCNILHGLEEFKCNNGCEGERPQDSAVEFASEEVKKEDWQRAANKYQPKRGRRGQTGNQQQRNTVVQTVQKAVVPTVRAKASTAQGKTNRTGRTRDTNSRSTS